MYINNRAYIYDDCSRYYHLYLKLFAIVQGFIIRLFKFGPFLPLFISIYKIIVSVVFCTIAYDDCLLEDYLRACDRLMTY